MRTMCQSGLLGFRYPPEFSIRTCLRWTIHRYERLTFDYLTHLVKPGDVFIDIGAHIGYFAKYAGQLVGTEGSVYAFEPHPYNYELLCQNCRHLQQVRPIQAAVSDSNGKVRMYVNVLNSCSHSLIEYPDAGDKIRVNVVSLDEWVLLNRVEKIDVVLIDVEGVESSVLRGMRDVIKKNPNIILIIEYCPSNRLCQNNEIDTLVEEIYGMKLQITYALGQKRVYSLLDLTSKPDIENELHNILGKEMVYEKVNYVNIVVIKPLSSSSVLRGCYTKLQC